MKYISKFIEKLFLSLFYLVIAAIFIACCYILYNGLACGASRGIIMGSFLLTGIILALSCITLLKK